MTAPDDPTSSDHTELEITTWVNGQESRIRNTRPDPQPDLRPDVEPALEWEIAALGHFPEHARELRQLISLLAEVTPRDTMRVELTGDTSRRVLNQLHAMPQRVATQLILLSATGYTDCLQAPTPGHLGIYRLTLPKDPP